MPHTKHAIGDTAEFPPSTYIVIKEKGYSAPYTQMINILDEDLKGFIKLPARAKDVLLVLAHHVGFDHVARIKMESLEELSGVKRTQLYNALYCLRENGFAKKVAKDEYGRLVFKINPNYFWKGKPQERIKAIEEWEQWQKEQSGATL